MNRNKMLKFIRNKLKIVNAMIPTRNNCIYAVPHTNCRKDCYDIINYKSDNLLCVINACIRKDCFPCMKIYLECFSEERMELIKNYLHQNNVSKLKVIPILSAKTATKIKMHKIRFLRNILLRFSCKYWFSDTPYVHFHEKNKNQKFICFNYSTPLKSERYIDSDYNDFSNCDGFLTTSLMTAQINSSEFWLRLYNCLILGFPRNDCLFEKSNNTKMLNWIRKKASFPISKIIVYAPTYRDYDGAYDNCNILGYKDENNLLEDYLSSHNYLLICKMHPLQKLTNTIISPHVVNYETTYDFSLYDLLAKSDLLISDYSSVIHDYIISSKPVILDLFDKNRYDETRGFAFDPLEWVYPGPIATSLQDVICAIENVFGKTNLQINSKESDLVRRVFHKHIDNKSTDRMVEYLSKLFKKK